MFSIPYTSAGVESNRIDVELCDGTVEVFWSIESLTGSHQAVAAAASILESITHDEIDCFYEKSGELLWMDILADHNKISNWIVTCLHH
jgi:hypothetical protein